MQDLEFTISQYLDGALNADERSAFEARVSTDTAARTLLDEYRRLDRMIKAMPPVPAVRFDELAASISEAVDAAYEARPSRVYRMPAWIRMAAMPLALAASLLIVAGVGIELFNSHRTPVGWPQGTPVDRTSSSLVAFETDKATGPVVEEVSIGPGTGMSSPANQPVVVGLGADEASSQSHVMVVSGVSPAHDTEPSSSSFDME